MRSAGVRVTAVSPLPASPSRHTQPVGTPPWRQGPPQLSPPRHSTAPRQCDGTEGVPEVPSVPKVSPQHPGKRPHFAPPRLGTAGSPPPGGDGPHEPPLPLLALPGGRGTSGW